MKSIVLAKKGKRSLARIIDVLILLFCSFILYFSAVYPNVFDSKTFIQNNDKLGDLYKGSGMFLYSDKGTFSAISSFSAINSLEELTSIDLVVDDQNFNGVNLTKALYTFYTEKYTSYGGQVNLSEEIFKSTILKVGTADSNIKDLIITTKDNQKSFTYELIDVEKTEVTIDFVVGISNDASSFVLKDSRISAINNENLNIMVTTFAWFIPCLVGFSFIFDLLIPLFSKNGESIGKYIFKIKILTKDGYNLKKRHLIPRWFCYIVIEFIFGALTFGGMFLVTYTMFLFNKKRRCLHDYFGNSVVIDRNQSIWYPSKEVELYFQKHYGDQK